MTNIIQSITPELPTFCLAGLLLLSLVLPLLASWLVSSAANLSQTGGRIAWAGQILAGFCGLLIRVLPQYSILWLVAAVVVTTAFARKLWRTGVPPTLIYHAPTRI